MEDRLLIQQFQEGNLKSYETLYKKYYKVLVVYAKQFVKDLQVAEDITQDTFVTVYEKRENIEIHTSFKSFMYTVVRNNCLNYLKKEAKMVDAPFSQNETLTEEEDTTTITNIELAEKLIESISKLPRQNQEIFKLSRYRGLTNEEIATKLNLTKRTVETHISNALKKLRADLLSIILLVLHFFSFSYVFMISNLSYL
ncbi:RNA polymerase sigma-70 factor [uncultured Algibacter sp.]|uniref:RNA polymerase sigma-70 factor n=1 Tax=uncultured Algibacter sp. TaxID=298659 RepID=UPI0032175984